MNINFLQYFQCPSCRDSYEIYHAVYTENNLKQGILNCKTCRVAIPVIKGFPLFNQSRPWSPNSGDTWVQEIKKNNFVTKSNYERFLEKKVKRGSMDYYAAFQPFNESTRAIYPLLELLAETLEPGDVILDTWCRTGWSGELLAGLFPEQHVISLWEGDNDVLGYNGFSYWLSINKRASNLDIVFTHPDYPLPFMNHSIKLVHGLDSLHRYRHTSFIPECLRVCHKKGVLIFPHIHLTNNKPEPFFERGCKQYHGKEWKNWLDALLFKQSRTGWILPENELFQAPESLTLTDQSDTDHYNALLLIADSCHEEKTLTSLPLAFNEYSRFIANPLSKVNPILGTTIDTPYLADAAITLLERHPCYKDFLNEIQKDTLEYDEMFFLWKAYQGYTLSEIAKNMSVTTHYAKQIAENLCKQELLHPAPVSRAMIDLQYLHSFCFLPSQPPKHFLDVWQNALKTYSDKQSLIVWTKDGSELTIDDANYLVMSIQTGLQAMGLQQGDHIAIVTNHHPEALLLCWAAWLNGLVTVIVDANYSLKKITHLYAFSQSKKLFTDNTELSSKFMNNSILFDSLKQPTNQSGFSNWLEGYLGIKPKSVTLHLDMNAVMLFTSGSSGMSKGVVLSQKAICESGFNMADTYNWSNERLFSLGPLSMMSGLRNPAISALISCSTILLPDSEACLLPVNGWEVSARYEATVITAVPMWLIAVLHHIERLTPAIRLQQVLVTGSTFAASLHSAEDKLGITISDYYGLTESGGICLISKGKKGFVPTKRSLVQIVNSHNNSVKTGEIGEVVIHSDQLMSEYWNDATNTSRVLKNNSLYTGDLAYRDENGAIYFIGRKDEMLKLRDGTAFYPQALEKKLQGIPYVESVAITLIQPEQILVVLYTGIDSTPIIKNILNDNINQSYQIILIDNFPINSNGKLERSKLMGIARRKLKKEYDSDTEV